MPRKDVLAFRDPGHGFHLHRVERKDRCGPPRPLDLQPPQHPPKQDRIQRMEQDVDEVIAERLQLPEVVFRPEAGKGQRIILEGGPWFGPDLSQAVDRSECLVLRDVVVIIPDEPARSAGTYATSVSNTMRMTPIPTDFQDPFIMAAALAPRGKGGWPDTTSAVLESVSPDRPAPPQLPLRQPVALLKPHRQTDPPRRRPRQAHPSPRLPGSR